MRDVRLRAEFDGKFEVLPRVLDFVGAACDEAGIIPEARFDLELAIEEACANVLEHAYSGNGGAFSVEFTVQGADVEIGVRDQGQAFKPDAVKPPDLYASGEERRVGGMGLHLMKTLMDEVEFSFTEQGNLLRMVKRNVAPGDGNA
jgi:serine/threonine-protein kinase RsbW